MTEFVTIEGHQLLVQLVSLRKEIGVVGAGVPLTRPYQLAPTDEAAELGGRVDILPLPQAKLCMYQVIAVISQRPTRMTWKPKWDFSAGLD